MFIDLHVHLGKRHRKDGLDLTAENVLKAMDKYGIEKAVIQPRAQSPENGFFHFDTFAALDVCKKYPDRYYTFCKLDPRNGKNSPDTDFSWVLDEFVGLGCKGMGELTANLWIDDPRYLNMFKQCGAAGLPCLLHIAARVGYRIYGAADDPGLPRFEKVIQELPGTVFIAHAQAWWAEIANNVAVDKREGYPKGEYPGFGRAYELLKKYPNLYGDISAGSGFNALSRDPEKGYKFLDELQDKLLFGTDICNPEQVLNIVPFMNDALANGKITKVVYDKITHINAQKLLKL
ncbi:MAG: amidohydrolase family protein [Elusimicrobiota bacterium]